MDYKEACEDLLKQNKEEFIKGAKALYHYLQDKIIGHSGNDAVSIEVLKFIRRLENEK